MTPALRQRHAIACAAFIALLAGCGGGSTPATPGPAATSERATALDDIPAAPTYSDWPAITSAIPRDAAMETRIAQIVAGMTLEQKVGQMTQPEIKSVTPAQVRQYF